MKKLLMLLIVGVLMGSVVYSDECIPRRWVELDPEGPVKILTTIQATSTTAWPFATTSGTSGCEGLFTNQKKVQQHRYVATTITNLAEDIARGGGPHLQSLSTLLGCPASAYSTLAIMSRQNYEQLFPFVETKPEVFLTRLKEKMRDNPSLAGRCVYI